jgi:PAS domain S-box-containing protein
MRSLLVATSERAELIAVILRSEGFELDVCIGSLGSAPVTPADYMLIFVEQAIGVDAIREVCLPFDIGATGFPLIAVIAEGTIASADADELIAAGVSVQLGGEFSSLASRVRFIRQAVRKRGQMVAAVHDREERHRTVIAALDEGLVVQDADGTVTAMNPRAGEILGISDDGVRDRVWRGHGWGLVRADGTVGGPADLPGLKALTLGEPVRGHVLGVKRPGRSVLWVSANSHLVRDASGKNVVGVVTTFSDVTDRRRAEDDFRQILEKTPDAVFICRNGRSVWVSKTFVALLGYDHARELVGVDVPSWVEPAHSALVAERLRIGQETAGVLPALKLAMLRRDGTLVDVVVTGGITLYEGEPAVICFTRDRTAQRLLEMELMETERLAALGRVAAGVGHEINNPLAYVMGNLSIAADRLRKGEDVAGIATLLEEALEGADRIRSIVRDLKIFATRRVDEHGAVDVHRVIDSCVRMTDMEIRHRARLVRAFGDVPAIKGNEARLAQVLLNVLLNAAHAIPEGRAHEATITVTTFVEADGRVAIEVRDTGTGITPEHLPHVFEPFFTTKGERGTGLGLSICQKLVAALGGEISIESDVGRGTCLTIRLLAERALEPRVAPTESPPPMIPPSYAT